MKTLKYMAALVALIFVSLTLQAAPACRCYTNWVAIPTWIKLYPSSPWMPVGVNSIPGPTIWQEVITCMCQPYAPYNNQLSIPLPGPIQTWTNHPPCPTNAPICTNIWSIAGSQIPDPLAPPGALPNQYLFMFTYKVQQCSNLVNAVWWDSGMCATSYVSAYSTLTCYYSNSVPVFTNTVAVDSSGVAVGSVGFGFTPDPTKPQMFFRIQ